jgi:hypothetical protein
MSRMVDKRPEQDEAEEVEPSEIEPPPDVSETPADEPGETEEPY